MHEVHYCKQYFQTMLCFISTETGLLAEPNHSEVVNYHLLYKQ